MELNTDSACEVNIDEAEFLAENQELHENKDDVKVRSKCQNCQTETNFVYESGYYCCEACGCGEERIQFVSDSRNGTFVQPGHSNVPISVTVPPRMLCCSNSKISRGQKSAYNKIKLVGERYNAAPEMTNNAIKIFNKLYPSIKHKAVTLKETVAGCCLFRVLENYGIPVLLNEFITVNNFRLKQFYRALKIVEKKCGKNVVGSTKDLIRAVLKNSSKLVEDFDDLIQKTEEILNLAERCWLRSGRSPSALIAACSYFAYRLYLIQHNDYHWSKVNFNEFCDRFEIKDQKTTIKKRINELKSLFLTLAQSDYNPLYNGNPLSEQDIETHLKYVLMFSKEIIKNFLASKSNSITEVSKKESVVLETFRKKHKVLDIKCEPVTLTDEQAQHLNSLADEDIINDEEMKEYIRSSDEVEKYKRLSFNIMDGIPVVDSNFESKLYKGLPKYEQDAKSDEMKAGLLHMSKVK